MCEARDPEHGVQCEMEGTGHLSHFAIGPTGTVKWRNEAAQPAPLPTPKARNGVTDEEKKTAKAVQDALKAERERTSGRGEATQVILGNRPELPIQGPTPPLPTREESVAAALDGEERATDHAIDAWKLQAKMVLVITACRLTTITVDDVWVDLVTPAEPKALGGIIKWAIFEGLIESTNQTTKSVRRHQAPIPIWRSLLAGQNPAEVCARLGLRYHPVEPALVVPGPPAGAVLRDFP